jgi:hypothetical protein
VSENPVRVSDNPIAGGASTRRSRLGSPGRRWLAILLLVVGVGAVWIAAQPIACGCGEFPPSPVQGVVVGVDSAGLGDVRGFRLRLPDGGGIIALTLGKLENPLEFTPGHLAEHQATGSPIRAYFRVANGDLVVYRLEDAPAASP